MVLAFLNNPFYFFFTDMVKSRAQIQKEYRQRLKEKDNAGYLEKERRRRRQSYLPNSQLPPKERKQRNDYNKDYLRHYRAKQKAALQLIQANNQPPESSTSGYESSTSLSVPADTRLVVQMRFQQKANGPKMRISKELNKIKEEMKTLQSKHDDLKRKYRTTARSLQRVKRQKTSGSASTPRSKTEQQLKDMNLSKDQEKSVRKELLFANAICHEIKSPRTASSAHNHNRSQVVRNLVSGKTMKRCRLIKTLAKKMGMCRNKLAKVSTKDITVEKVHRIRETGKHKIKVIRFFERDDNSRVMPGKADCVKIGGKEKAQKRILTDYLSNLYHKFMMEHARVKLSFTTFTRIRPKNILLTSFIRRDTCLCTKHQNMSFTLKSVKHIGVDVSLNAETEIDNQQGIIQEITKTSVTDQIVLSQWKRVQVEEKGKKKMTMKVVDSTVNKEDFIAHVTGQMNEFKEHVTRIKTQYAEMKQLKQQLPPNHCIVHMDFAENYSCKSVQEIQSAYWNKTSVTIHPVVIYYKVDGSDEMLHKSIIIISDEMGHNTSTVLSIIDKIVPEIKMIKPNVSCIHYWTDSPTSQYRNKGIFNAVANHKHVHGISAKWNYWEAGHGKGPCDGIGGTSKRMADEAVRTGKVTIQDPMDFFAWTQSPYCNLKSIKFIFLSTEDCQKKFQEVSGQRLRPIPGTMKLHAVAGQDDSVTSIAVRNTSCYCGTCLSETFTCNSWRIESLVQNRGQGRDNEDMLERTSTNECTPGPVPNESRALAETYHTDEFVAAKYGNACYVGKVLTIDIEDDTLEISFLEQKKQMFQWPFRPDVIWVEIKDIICTIAAPEPSGKSKRMLKIKEEDLKKIQELYPGL